MVAFFNWMCEFCDFPHIHYLLTYNIGDVKMKTYRAKVINQYGDEITLEYSYRVCKCVNSGNSFPCNLKLFLGIVKENNGIIYNN